MHVNKHFSLHINVNLQELANEPVFICSPWAGPNKLVPNVINRMLQQVLQNNTIYKYIT